jgi:hypothetical protein
MGAEPMTLASDSGALDAGCRSRLPVVRHFLPDPEFC